MRCQIGRRQNSPSSAILANLRSLNLRIHNLVDQVAQVVSGDPVADLHIEPGANSILEPAQKPVVRESFGLDSTNTMQAPEVRINLLDCRFDYFLAAAPQFDFLQGWGDRRKSRRLDLLLNPLAVESS